MPAYLPHTFIFKYRIHITFVFSNVLFAFSGFEISSRNLLAISAFALCNMAFHIYNKALDHETDRQNISTDEVILTDADVRKMIYITLALCGSAILIILLTRQAILPLLAYSSLVFLYNIRGINLKRFFLVKNFYMALFYALPFTFYTYFYRHTGLDNLYYITLCYYILLVMAFESIWDIKDITGDRIAGVSTMANKFGVGITKAYALLLVILASLLEYWSFGRFSIMPTLMFGVYLLFIRKNSPHWVYHLPVLGLLTFQCYMLFWIIYGAIK